MSLSCLESYHQTELYASARTRNLMPFAESAAAEVRRLIDAGNSPEQAAALVTEEYVKMIDATRVHDPEGAELELRFSLGSGRWWARPDLGRITEATRTLFPERTYEQHRTLALAEARRRWKALLRTTPPLSAVSGVQHQAGGALREIMAALHPRSREKSGNESSDDPDAAFRRRASSVAAIRQAVGVKFSDDEKSFWRIRLAQRGARGGLAHGKHF